MNKRKTLLDRIPPVMMLMLNLKAFKGVCGCKPTLNVYQYVVDGKWWVRRERNKESHLRLVGITIIICILMGCIHEDAQCSSLVMKDGQSYH